jgi:hypothetical protein
VEWSFSADTHEKTNLLSFTPEEKIILGSGDLLALVSSSSQSINPMANDTPVRHKSTDSKNKSLDKSLNQSTEQTSSPIRVFGHEQQPLFTRRANDLKSHLDQIRLLQNFVDGLKATPNVNSA